MPFMLLHRVKKPIMAPNSRKNARQDKSATHYSEDVDCENRMGIVDFFRPDTERDLFAQFGIMYFCKGICLINSLAKIYTNLYLV